MTHTHTCRYPKGGGKPIKVTDEFFWIVVTMRSPYNGALTADLWVSYMKLTSFPYASLACNMRTSTADPLNT